MRVEWNEIFKSNLISNISPPTFDRPFRSFAHLCTALLPSAATLFEFCRTEIVFAVASI